MMYTITKHDYKWFLRSLQHTTNTTIQIISSITQKKNILTTLPIFIWNFNFNFNFKGSGLRCGFLGFLHMEVFTQRLQDEFNVQIIMTSPSVPYKIEYPDGRVEMISNVGNWPDPTLLGRGTLIKGIFCILHFVFCMYF